MIRSSRHARPKLARSFSKSHRVPWSYCLGSWNGAPITTFVATGCSVRAMGHLRCTSLVSKSSRTSHECGPHSWQRPVRRSRERSRRIPIQAFRHRRAIPVAHLPFALLASAVDALNGVPLLSARSNAVEDFWFRFLFVGLRSVRRVSQWVDEFDRDGLRSLDRANNKVRTWPLLLR